jgi:UDP-GlcNAc:undecaprenyl-phosphate/decaprenyl-phosphate GlcNAc-1-phosphate transferase
MKSYFVLFLVSLVATLFLTPLVRWFAFGWGVVDVPDEARRIHKCPTPRLGGVAIFLAFALTLAGVPLLNNLLSQGFAARWPSLEPLFLPGLLIFLLGVYDDFRGLNAPTKTTVQVLAALLLYFQGYGVSALSLPFDAQWQLPVWLGILVTVLWVVGITNAFNLIDGIDGLASGAAVFALLTLFITSLLRGATEICVISIILIGAVMGFLRYNFNPASIFLGDSGSLFLGFMCAALSLASAQKSSTLIAVAIPLVSFGFPIIEVGLSMARRFVSGAPVFQSDRRHIHHMLLARGLNQRQAVSLLYGVCALFSLFGIMLLSSERNSTAVILAIVGVCLVLGVQHLRYDEFDALGKQLRRGVRIRRRAIAVELQLRQAAAGLRAAQDFHDVSATLNQLFATSEFDCATLEVYAAPPRAGLAATAGSELGSGGTLHALARHAPQCVHWSWNWQNEKIDLAEALASPHFWSLRVPLAGSQGQPLGAITFFRHVMGGDFAVDLTKICGGLREELSAALERLADAGCVPAPASQPLPAQLVFSRG